MIEHLGWLTVQVGHFHDICVRRAAMYARWLLGLLMTYYNLLRKYVGG